MVPLLAAGATLLGGYLQGRGAQSAARTQAEAQREAARLAAEEARFRPVGITTRFGQSQFQYSPEGRVTGASYELSPEARAFQDRLFGLAGGGLTQAEQAQGAFAPLATGAQGLFGLGQQYISTPVAGRIGELSEQYLRSAPMLDRSQDQQILDLARAQLGPSASAQAITSMGQQYLGQSPQEVAQRYMASQQELLAPTRERQLAQLQNTLFQTGRSGLSVGATGARPSGAAGLSAASPEMEAYYNALAQQDAALAAQAQEAGQRQVSFGAGLLGQGQALGQSQIGLGLDLLGRQQSLEAQRQALEQGRYGFGANLLTQQQALEQGRIGFGAGLFGTGGNLLTQGYQGQTAALGPYQAYLTGLSTLESMGQQPLDIGINLGAKGQSTSVADALFKGGTAAAAAEKPANAYNPFATALTGAAASPQIQGLLDRLFSRPPTPVDMTGFRVPYTAPTYQFTPSAPTLGSGTFDFGPSSYGGGLGSGTWGL